MNYKTIIKSRKTRFSILKALKFVPDQIMLRIQYRMQLDRWPNLKKPKRYTEKLQKYKMCYRNPVLHQCVDKYEVRKYVEGKGLSNTLNKLYGVFSKAEEIDFSKLPERFVIKTTDGGGGNTIIICKDKSKLDITKTIDEVNSWLDASRANAGREWAYVDIEKSQIIVEEYLENPENPDAGIEDFKILCFNGEPQFIIVDKDRYIDHKRNFYTIDWKRVNVDTDHEQFNNDYPKPKNLSEMLDIACKLSADFPHVRVDLYNIEGKIIFGELTFYPWSGYVQFTPDDFDFELGRYFTEY